MHALAYSTFLARVAQIHRLRRERIADMARAVRIGTTQQPRDFIRALRELED